MRLLVVYGTTDGQTAEIAERIARTLGSKGHEVELRDADTVEYGFSARAYDAIVVGGSIHLGKYQRGVTRFIRRHRADLRWCPSAFFSVCMAIESKSEKDRAEALAIPRNYVEHLGWHPDAVEVVAGALKFSEYGFFRRMAMKSISEKEMGTKIDTGRDYEFTDWDQVDRFALGFAAYAEKHSGDLLRPGASAGAQA